MFYVAYAKTPAKAPNAQAQAPARAPNAQAQAPRVISRQGATRVVPGRPSTRR